MNPILRGLPHKILLTTASRAITFDRVPSGSHKIVEPRQVDDKGVIIVLEERFRFQPCSKDRPQMPRRLFLTSISGYLHWP